MDYIHFRSEDILVSHSGTSMMTLSAKKISSDTVAITYEWSPGLLCGDDDKGIILAPYVLSLMI